MAKSIVIAAFLLVATASVGAYGQDNSLVAPGVSKPAPGHLLDQDYTDVDRRNGAAARRSARSGPTPLDRKIQQEDNQIDNSICKGC